MAPHITRSRSTSLASPFCLWLWSLAATPCTAEATDASERPPCRKSPELHTLVWPDGEERLLAYGGKGFDWVRKKGKKHDDAVEYLGLNASGVLEMASKGKRKGKRKLKKQVKMFGDTWAFHAPSEGWQKVTLESAAAPLGRWKSSGCSVDGGRAMVLFGGDETTAESGMLNDLWVFKTHPSGAGGTWTQFFTVNPPRRRRGHVAACNATHLVVIGGKSWTRETSTIVNTDVWALPLEALGFGDATAAKEAAMAAAVNGSVGKVTSLDSSLRLKKTQPPVLSPLSWTPGASFPGRPRWGATGTILRGPTGLEVVAIFGGRNKNRGAKRHATDKSAYTYYNELWLFDLQANSWSKANVRGAAPQPRDHHGATDLYGDLYIFGGRVMELKTRDAVANDLWSYSLWTESWTLHKAVGAAPIPRYMPGVASTQWKGQPAVTIFGGETLPGSTKRTSMNDVWVYALGEDGKRGWSELSPSDCSSKAVAAEVLAELAAEGMGGGRGGGARLLILAWAVTLLAFLAGVCSGAVRRRLGGDLSTLLRPLRSSLLPANIGSSSSSSTTGVFVGDQVTETGYISID